MPSEDPLPRRTNEIDEEIKHARQKLNEVVRRRRLVFLSCGVGAAAEIASIALAIQSHNPNSGWYGVAVYVGFALVIGGIYVGVGISAEADNGEFDIARATVIKRRTELEQLAIERRELLIGNVAGQAAIYARYREAMPELVARYRDQANRYRAVNNALQSFVIVASLATSGVTGLFGASYRIRAGVVGVTLAIAIASSMTSFFRLRERGAQLQKTADSIEIEFRAVELGINDYANVKKPDALRTFVQKIEQLRSEHMASQRQLDQPADLRYIDASSISIDRRLPHEGG
jgi:glycerol uptake facilitator-like aquaporin